MKKIIVIAVLLFYAVLGNAFYAVAGTYEEVLQLFNKTFSDVQNVKWFTLDKEYIAYFTQNEVRTKVSYDYAGKFLRSRRELTSEYLPLNILSELKEKFNGKVIKSVTEIVEGNEISYSLNIEDENNIWVIEAFPNGNVKQLLKFKKQVVK